MEKSDWENLKHCTVGDIKRCFIEHQQLFCDHEVQSMRERLRELQRQWPAIFELLSSAAQAIALTFKAGLKD